MRPHDAHEKGWECPRCERIWSPQVVACGTCALELQVRKANRSPLLPGFFQL